MFQGILSILLIISYYYNTPWNSGNKQLKELWFVIGVLILYIVISLSVWIKSLLKYIKFLEDKNEKLMLIKTEFKSEIDIKGTEKIINSIIKGLEDYKENIGK